MSLESEVKGPQFFVLLDANSQRVFWGQLISQACDKLMSVGMIWVLSTEFSPKWVPWFIAFGALPHFLLAYQSGHLINRWGALRTVIGADLFRGVLFMICAWLTMLAKHDNHLLALLMVTAIISNIAGALFNPAILSLPVSMMDPGEKRDKLTALIDSCFSFGNVLGPLLSALAYALTGLAGTLAINGLSYFFSAILAIGIKLQKPQNNALPVDAETGETTEIPAPKTVQQVLKTQPVIFGMLITFLLMNFFLAPLMIFMPWYAKNIYADGIAGLAKLEAFLGLGTVVGGLLLSFVKVPGSTWKRVSISLTLMSLAYLGFTFSHQLWLGCVSVLALGFFLAVANVIILTFFQSAPEAQDVPVVMGMVNLISVASLPISMGVLGSFIEFVQVPQFAAVCAIIVIAIAASIRLIPGIQRV